MGFPPLSFVVFFPPVYHLWWIDLSGMNLNHTLVSFLFIPFLDGQQIWELEATVDKDKSQTVSTVNANTTCNTSQLSDACLLVNVLLYI